MCVTYTAALSVVCLLSLGGVSSQTWVGSHLAPILGRGVERGLLG